MPDDSAARWVLQQYPLAAFCRAVVSLGNRGGFSGAQLWRVETAAGSFCLRAWQAEGISSPQLSQIHDLMQFARQQGLAFVPSVCQTTQHRTHVEHAGRIWDLTEWMSGQSDFHANPANEKLEAACIALAELHQVWKKKFAASAACPAIARRLERLQQWHALLERGWRPDYSLQLTLSSIGQRAWNLVQNLLPTHSAPLLHWQASNFALQPCLCDIWHDHVLFEGNQVAGIIDYGSAKVDHIAVDLARLLGSFVGDDDEKWQIGLRAYRLVRPLSQQEEDLARLLDRSGTLLALVNWLRWLYLDRRRFEDVEIVAARLEQIIRRVERW